MAAYLVENGKDLCQVSSVAVHPGATEVIEMPMLGGRTQSIPGRREPDRVSS